MRRAGGGRPDPRPDDGANRGPGPAARRGLEPPFGRTHAADQRRLCVRLYNRKRTWFRVAQLQYQDISDAGAAAAALCANGLLLDGTAALFGPLRHRKARPRMLTRCERALPLAMSASATGWAGRAETALTSVEDALPLMDATELRALARQLQLPRATVAVKVRRPRGFPASGRG